MSHWISGNILEQLLFSYFLWIEGSSRVHTFCNRLQVDQPAAFAENESADPHAGSMFRKINRSLIFKVKIDDI